MRSYPICLSRLQLWISFVRPRTSEQGGRCGNKANVSFVGSTIIPEAIIRALELRKGTVDLALALNVLPPDMIEALREDENLRVPRSNGR